MTTTTTNTALAIRTSKVWGFDLFLSLVISYVYDALM